MPTPSVGRALTRTPATPPTLRRRSRLVAQLTELDATLDAFESADATLVGEAERAARGLTPPRRCVDALAPASVDPRALAEYSRRPRSWCKRSAARAAGTRHATTRWSSSSHAATLGDPYARSEAAFHLGMNRKRTGQYEAAEAALTSAYYAAAEAELAERAAKAALGQLQLAQRRADYATADQWIRHAQTWIARVPDNKQMQIELLVSRADLDGDRSRYDDAFARLDEAWDLCERDPDSPHTGRILNLRALLHIDRGDYDEAERLLQQSERIDLAHLGPGHPNLIHVHNNMGTIHYHRRNFAEAKDAWQRAYDIAVAASGEGSIHTGVLLMNLGDRGRRARRSRPGALAVRAGRVGVRRAGGPGTTRAWPTWWRAARPRCLGPGATTTR